MLPKRNGVVLDQLATGRRRYIRWLAALFECPGCGHQSLGAFRQAEAGDQSPRRDLARPYW